MAIVYYADNIDSWLIRRAAWLAAADIADNIAVIAAEPPATMPGRRHFEIPYASQMPMSRIELIV